MVAAAGTADVVVVNVVVVVVVGVLLLLGWLPVFGVLATVAVVAAAVVAAVVVVEEVHERTGAVVGLLLLRSAFVVGCYCCGWLVGWLLFVFFSL